MTPPSVSQMSFEWLDAHFGRTDSPGWSRPVRMRDGEELFSRTFKPTAMCWSWAREVESELGSDRVDLTGYFCADESTALMADLADGHDLAIVDGRFLVDGWLAHVAESGPCVIDLADPEGMALALSIHEPFSTWTVPPVFRQQTETGNSGKWHPVPSSPVSTSADKRKAS